MLTSEPGRYTRMLQSLSATSRLSTVFDFTTVLKYPKGLSLSNQPAEHGLRRDAQTDGSSARVSLSNEPAEHGLRC